MFVSQKSCYISQGKALSYYSFSERGLAITVNCVVVVVVVVVNSISIESFSSTPGNYACFL